MRTTNLRTPPWSQDTTRINRLASDKALSREPDLSVAVEVIFPSVAGTYIRVRHGLPTVPTKFAIVEQTNAGDVRKHAPFDRTFAYLAYDSTLAASKARIAFW